MEKIIQIKKLLVALCLLTIVSQAKAYKLTTFIPVNNPTGTAIIVCPGGSYFWLDKENEGVNVAKWLCQNGIAAFVLEYSHGGWASFAFHIRTKGRSFPAGFNDIRHALYEVRTNADKFGIKKDRVGCMGFSAGGHLVMHAAEQLAGTSETMAFAAPIYPVVSMSHSCTHKRSRRGLLGEHPSPILIDSLSLEHHVPVGCPPVFLMNCDDDPVVHPYNSVLLDSALTARNINHLYVRYGSGGHGFGVDPKKTTSEAIMWKETFLKWLHELIK